VIQLTIRKDGSEQPDILEFEQSRISIGRRGANQVQLIDASISRDHAEIIEDNGDYFVIDLNSGNGTFLHGKRIPANERVPLHDRDKIRVEPFTIEFSIGGAVQEIVPKAEEPTDQIAYKMVRQVLRSLDAGESPILTIVAGPREGAKIELVGEVQEITIGRDARCDLKLDDDLSSREHVRVRRDWNGVHIKDLKSKNGTFVNNRRIVELTLKDQDEVKIGSSVLLFSDPRQRGGILEIDVEAPTQMPDEQKQERLEQYPVGPSAAGGYNLGQQALVPQALPDGSIDPGAPLQDIPSGLVADKKDPAIISAYILIGIVLVVLIGLFIWIVAA